MKCKAWIGLVEIKDVFRSSHTGGCRFDFDIYLGRARERGLEYLSGVFSCYLGSFQSVAVNDLLPCSILATRARCAYLQNSSEVSL